MKLEADWSRYVCDRLKKSGWFIQRIESGTTGRGIPDIFAVTPEGKPIWIENKIIAGLPEGYVKQIRLPYRPGQIAWHEHVYKAMPILTLTRIVNADLCLVTRFTPKYSLMKGYATIGGDTLVGKKRQLLPMIMEMI